MWLPPCHSRRTWEGVEDVFFCAHPKVCAPSQLVTAEVCGICRLRAQPPPEAFRDFPPTPPGDGAGGIPAADWLRRLATGPRGPCQHLGEQVGLRDCPGCRGRVQVKVFACGHPRHRETVLSEGAACPDYEPRAGAGPGG
jgi:hypothetical protein